MRGVTEPEFESDYSVEGSASFCCGKGGRREKNL
jgi:hypothetical protein